jgi:hypothetical protein
LRLVEKYRDQQDPDPVALACYGLLRGDSHRVLLRFVEGRPVSEMTIAFLDWVCNQLEREGKKGLLLVWDPPQADLLAHERASPRLAQGTQRHCQAGRWGPHRFRPAPGEKPLAESHRTLLGSW